MYPRKTITMAAFAAVLALFLFSPLPAAGDGFQGWFPTYRLEGAWLVVNPAVGIRGLETLIPQDLLGRKATIQLESLSADPTVGGFFPDADYLSLGVGEAVMTGPKTFKSTIVAYSMREEDPRDEIECIWVITSSSTFTGHRSQEATASFAIYLPSADQNGDLLPDAGAVPIVCIPLPFNAERVPMMPPCEP